MRLYEVRPKDNRPRIKTVVAAQGKLHARYRGQEKLNRSFLTLIATPEKGVEYSFRSGEAGIRVMWSECSQRFHVCVTINGDRQYVTVGRRESDQDERQAARAAVWFLVKNEQIDPWLIVWGISDKGMRVIRIEEP